MRQQRSNGHWTRARAAIAFVVLFVLYQCAEGIGQRWLHLRSVQAGFMLACVLAAWPLSRWLGYRGYGAWALTARPHGMAWLAGGLALAFVAKACAVWFGRHHGIYIDAAVPAPQPMPPWAWALPMLLVSTFVPSLAEDILTRGFWYRASGIRWRHGVAFVAASAAIYVFNHIYRLDHGPMEWLMLGCFGIAYATALWRAGTLWAAVGLHWGWNLANGVLDAVVPTDITDAAASDVLSAAVHVGIAALLLLVPGVRPRLAPARAAPADARRG